MRVYLKEDGWDEYKDYPNATHWESSCSDWLELLNDKEEIVCILNWKHVVAIEPILQVT